MKIIWILAFLVSCASVKSGKYITVKEKDTLESLSETFDVPTWLIKASNTNAKIKPGQKIFIPLNWGILGDGLQSSIRSLGAKDYIWPVPNSKNISSQFGHRWGKSHEGIDIPARTGSHILAVSDGVVVYSGNDLTGYGNIIVIGHRYGIFSVYAHCNKNYVSHGDRVHRGQVIGEVGNTGRSTGPHLHFEVRRNGRAMNPLFVVQNN